MRKLSNYIFMKIKTTVWVMLLTFVGFYYTTLFKTADELGACCQQDLIQMLNGFLICF